MLENWSHQITKDGDSENEQATLSSDKGFSVAKPQHANPSMQLLPMELGPGLALF